MDRRRGVYQFIIVCFAVALFAGAAARAEVPDADWPVTRHPSEASLKAKIDTLASLVEKIENRGLDASYARSALVLARDFIVYAAEDERNGRPGRAAYVRGYLDESLDAAIGEAQALIRNPKLNRPVPRPPLRDITIRDGAFFAGKTEVMFGGVGHFSKVREDIPKFSDYGFNLIQIEIGPSRVVNGPNPEDVRTDRIEGDILKALDNAAAHGVMVNLLLSPHYFPGWATEMYPALKECGRGFLQYCVSDPDARRVLRRYLQALIPMVKDKPALQSYALANEPMFFEKSEASQKAFRAYLKEKYGTVGALNRAWRAKYKDFDRVKVAEDLLAVNAAARLDWSRWHYKVCTEFFFWMKSVIRTMDKRTPVHIKFMDNMFESDEANWGIDRGALSRFTEILGNDATTRYLGFEDRAMDNRQNASFYDFLKSMQPEKPIQNSETHIIADDAERFYPAEYIKAALWQEYLHGMAASTIWVWERGDGPTLGNNILSRPNCAAAAARVTLDVRRLAPQITAIANSIADSPVAIYYSDTTRALQADFLEKWRYAYEIARYTGWPARFVTDDMLGGLDPRGTQLLIVPEYVFSTDELYEKMLGFVRRGGHVAAIGYGYRMDERMKKRNTDAWDALTCGRPAAKGSGCIARLDASSKSTLQINLERLDKLMGGEFKVRKPILGIKSIKNSPISGVEYRSAKYGRKRVGYIFNSLNRNVTVKLDAGGKGWRGTKDLIDGGPITQELRLKPMDIVLFEF